MKILFILLSLDACEVFLCILKPKPIKSHLLNIIQKLNLIFCSCVNTYSNKNLDFGYKEKPVQPEPLNACNGSVTHSIVRYVIS